MMDGAGIQIEEPFCILPMDMYCKILAENVLEMYNKCQGTKIVFFFFHLSLYAKSNELDMKCGCVRVCVGGGVISNVGVYALVVLQVRQGWCVGTTCRFTCFY